MTKGGGSDFFFRFALCFCLPCCSSSASFTALALPLSFFVSEPLRFCCWVPPFVSSHIWSAFTGEAGNETQVKASVV